MEFDDETSGSSEKNSHELQLPRHLAALVGALQGPPDLGAHHDRYLTYPHREESGGAATA
jgi:hypothetical protein